MEVANGSGPILHLNGSGRSSVEEQAILFTFRVILEGSRRSFDPLDDVSVVAVLIEAKLTIVDGIRACMS